MRYLKRYNLFESSSDYADNSMLDIVDCYIDLFDEYGFSEFKVEDLPGYNGIPVGEKSSSRPYVTIDRVNKVSIPFDSIVYSNCRKGGFANQILADEYLASNNITYFTINKMEEDNPGYRVVVFNRNIPECWRDQDMSKIKGFSFIPDRDLRRLLSEGHDRTFQHISKGNERPNVYSFKGECLIHYYLKPYRFKRSDLGRDLSRGFINREEYDKLMRTATNESFVSKIDPNIKQEIDDILLELDDNGFKYDIVPRSVDKQYYTFTVTTDYINILINRSNRYLYGDSINIFSYNEISSNMDHVISYLGSLGYSKSDVNVIYPGERGIKPFTGELNTLSNIIYLTIQFESEGYKGKL